MIIGSKLMNLLEIRDRIVDNWNPETRMTMITHEQLDNLI